MWDQEVPGMFVDLSICKHRVYKALYFDSEPRGGVPIEFDVVGVVIELSLSFVDVIFLAEDDKCGSFVHGFDNHVLTLSKFAEGNPFIGRKVVCTPFELIGF